MFLHTRVEGGLTQLASRKLRGWYCAKAGGCHTTTTDETLTTRLDSAPSLGMLQLPTRSEVLSRLYRLLRWYDLQRYGWQAC